MICVNGNYTPNRPREKIQSVVNQSSN
uniref:Uncharacterized protein n=1 Tax=Rhizophora mucronata TaxID=61149 RepID=A0A2P2NZ08_RHIMU